MQKLMTGSTLAAWLLGATFAIHAAEPCTGFKWNVDAELALFRGEAATQPAGVGAASAPVLQTGKLYELSLSPQDQVRFSAAPSKKMLGDGSHAGLARVRVDRPGKYRVAVDGPFWLDVVDGIRPLESLDFNGVASCDKPRKIILYELPAGRELVLQVSNAPPDKVRVTITPAG